jgi:hypothetical protein
MPDTLREAAFEIETATCETDGGVFAYYVRGHVDPAAFYGQVRCDYGTEGLPPFGYVRQFYWRSVPRGDGWRVFVEGRGRGAFPVTALEVEAWHCDRALPRIIASNEATCARFCPDPASCYHSLNMERLRARWAQVQGRMEIAAPTATSEEP